MRYPPLALCPGQVARTHLPEPDGDSGTGWSCWSCRLPLPRPGPLTRLIFGCIIGWARGPSDVVVDETGNLVRRADRIAPPT